MKRHIFVGLVGCACLAAPFTVFPALNDPTATVVYLRTSCGALDNCATSMNEVTNWLWNVRNPTPTSRVLVDIGPGEFGLFKCLTTPDVAKGYVTLRGSGPDTTKLIAEPYTGTISQGSATQAILVENCRELVFEDLSAVIPANGSGTGLFYTIRWLGEGNSTWNNVKVENHANAQAFRAGGWYQPNCGDGTSLHYWFASKFLVVAGRGGAVAGYTNNCGESWFYGSEIEVIADNGTASSANIAGIELGGGQVQLFGTSVRMRVDAANPMLGSVVGMTGVSSHMFSSAASGVFHMHGGVVSVNAAASPASFDVYGITTNEMAHTSGVAYVLKPPAGGGQAIRLTNPMSEAAVDWPQSMAPPAITSITGADTFVETDCDATGNCDTPTGATHPNMMVYDTSCAGAGGPWYNMNRNACRGE